MRGVKRVINKKPKKEKVSNYVKKCLFGDVIYDDLKF
jgi:hypothetical protein